MKLSGIPLFVFSILLYSCLKTNSAGNNPSNLYVGGYSGNLGNNNQGAIWKNGVVNAYPNSSEIFSVCTYDTDLYACGGNTYWKNGLATTLPDLYISTQIAVSANDIYIIGTSIVTNNTGAPAAEYWKNGTRINLSQNMPNLIRAGAAGVAISGSDVYVCGVVSTGPLDTMTAVYWKNGQINYLPDGMITKCIAVSGSDVYIGGVSFHNGDVYWKNGVEQSIGNSPGNIFATINAITASGPDVYIGGYIAPTPSFQGVYWKNGQLIGHLSDCNLVNGIAVSGSTIYCSGKTNTDNAAAYWENENKISLGIGESSCIVSGR